MKQLFSLVALCALAGKSYSQNCIANQPQASACGNVVETFNQGIGGFLASGLAWDPIKGALYAEFYSALEQAPTTKTMTVTTPAYYKLATQLNTIIAGFTVNIGSKLTVRGIQIEVLNSQLPDTDPAIATCLQTGLNMNGNKTVCIGVTSPNIKTEMMLKYRFTFTVSVDPGIANLGLNTITIDNFSTTTGTQAPLPVRFSGLFAKTSGNGVQLTWNVDTELSLKGYEVERSADGVHYNTIGWVDAAGQRSYNFTDHAPVNGYYRIKSVDIDGKFGYSTIISVKGGSSVVEMKAYPSPATSELRIQYNTAEKGSVIRVLSVDGRLITTLQPVAGEQQTRIDLRSYTPGLYLAQMITASGRTETIRFVKQ